MTTPSGNPFVFPGMGLGQNPEHLAGNPLLQSFEMMRNAWTSMGSQMLSGGIPTPPILNIEELDRRINELRAVENWLRLNLTMLQGSIQAMEVQRATIATLQSFANMGGGAMPSAAAPGSQQPSPLEVALGMKGSSQPTREQDNASDQNKEAAPPAGGDSTQAGDPSRAAAGASGAAAPAPHQAWWNMLQNQFNQLASAAAATLTPDASGATPGTSPADRTSSSGTPAPAKAARKSARPAARKSAPRKS